MAYYLGRDLDIALMTEHGSLGLSGISTSGVRSMAIRNFAISGGGTYFTAAADEILFAPPRDTRIADLFEPETVMVVGEGSAHPDFSLRPENITGVDLSVSTQDEDVQFIGQRNILKAEVKKENSITITRKKKDDIWDIAYNEARFGLNESGALGDGHYQPDFFGYGYRVALRFKTGGAGEVFVLPNCCITEHTVTVGADSSQEESLTFVSYVNPIITDGTSDTAQQNALVDNADGM
tara:strand:+ start:1659 stop:2369 length:711 start_codon:yes stop_codon:yes gene_type:complete